MEAFGVIPGTVQSCSALLRKGNLLAIAPGGVYEAQLGDNDYQLLWKERLGYAKVAIEAKVVSSSSSNCICSLLLNEILLYHSPSFQFSHEISEKLSVLSTSFTRFGTGCIRKLICLLFQSMEVFQSS